MIGWIIAALLALATWAEGWGMWFADIFNITL